MSLETVTYVADLTATNPTATDPKSQGDDHIRNIKSALRLCFAGFAGVINVTGTNGGAADAYTLTPTTAITAYSTNMLITFIPNATNTGAVTMNISGLGTKSVKSVAGAALVAGDLVISNVYQAIYNGTEFRLVGITKQYADQLSLSAALPSQPGGTTTYHLTSLGGVASFTRTIIPIIEVVTVSDTWTCPAGVTRTEVWATGGSASGNTGANSNPGGTAGSTGMKVFTVTPGIIYTRTIGAGGAAVLTASTAGNAGGNTTFSGSDITTLTAPGGPATISGGTDSPSGLACTGADLSIPGGSSSGGVNNQRAGFGGASHWSGNAPQNTAGAGYGAGPGGVYNSSTGLAGNSGVIIQRY